MKAIEKKLFNTADYKGWLSKLILNYYGIDTEKDNRGIYAGKSVQEVLDELYASSDIFPICVANLLKDKYL